MNTILKLRRQILLVLAIAMLLSGNVLSQPDKSLRPTLESQLEKEYFGRHVVENSELADLIKSNQDFEMLRDDEFNDIRGLPPWLRVWWRKAHPEGEYTASDPTKGYPLVLKEILEWMMTHQDLKAGPGMGKEGEESEEGEEKEKGDSEIVQSLTGADYSPKNGIGNKDGENFIRALIGPNVRTSGAQTVPRSESDVRINFFDPQKILVGSNNIVGSGQQGIYRSLDGGATWAQTTLPFGTTGDTSHSDPTVDWTSDGRAWSSTLGIVGGTLRMRNYFSTDNGATWTFEATPSGTQTSVDKQMVWIDKSATSPFFGQTYATWHNGLPAFVNRRTAGAGGTWLGTPIQVSGAESTGTAIGGDIKSNRDGHVFVFWPTTTNRVVIVRKSTDGGNTYLPAVQIATTFDGFDIGIPSFNSRRAFIYVSGGAYKTATKDLVYATWTDLSGDTGCTAAANEPGSNVASTCKMRVWFSRSTNGGTTWSTPVKINNQATNNDQFSQWMAVDEATGALGIIYNDTVGDPGRLKSDIWYQRSFDDGVTWSAAEKVTTAMTDETITGANLGNQYGDYNGLSLYGGILFPSWTDRRDAAREEIYTAKITDPACTAPGDPVVGTATATAANQVTVTWSNGTPASTSYNVYRSLGTCAAPGPYTQIASNVAGTSFVDNTVSGGSTYSYKITGKDSTGGCESSNPGCVQATATGACTLTPTFTGLDTVTNSQGAGCRLNLSWTAGSSRCASTVTYNIYRSTTSGFTPGPGNLIASGVTGSSYSDGVSLMSGTTYYYIVRAVDASNGNAETNTVQKSGVPTGPVTVGTLTETFEAAGGFDNPGWTHQAIAGAVDWVYSTAQSQTPTHSWFSDSESTVTNRVLVSPSFNVTPTTTLSFWHTFAFEGTVAQCYDGGTLEYSTNGTVWTVVPDANFTSGGFNGTINSGFSNPLAGKRAYCSGTIGAMTQVNVNLASLAGNTIQLRWHEGDDSSAQVTGWFVDSVTITNAGIASSCAITASGVSVAGRVLSSDGRGVTNAKVTITDSNGQSRTVIAGRRGDYRFDDVESGQTYVMSVASRRYTFSPRIVQIVDNVSDLDFYPDN